MLIFHIAEKSRWDAAQLAGSYAQSTLGRTIEDEGFIHAAREDQWEGVRERYYAEASGPLVLLVIDTEKLSSPWREDAVGDTTYPHIHGPLNLGAVVDVRPLDAASPARPQRSLMQEFVSEMSFRMILTVLVMGFALLCGVLAAAVSERLGLVGILAGLAVGAYAAWPLTQRRNRRLARR